MNPSDDLIDRTLGHLGDELDHARDRVAVPLRSAPVRPSRRTPLVLAGAAAAIVAIGGVATFRAVEPGPPDVQMASASPAASETSADSSASPDSSGDTEIDQPSGEMVFIDAERLAEVVADELPAGFAIAVVEQDPAVVFALGADGEVVGVQAEPLADADDSPSIRAMLAANAQREVNGFRITVARNVVEPRVTEPDDARPTSTAPGTYSDLDLDDLADGVAAGLERTTVDEAPIVRIVGVPSPSEDLVPGDNSLFGSVSTTPSPRGGAVRMEFTLGTGARGSGTIWAFQTDLDPPDDPVTPGAPVTSAHKRFGHWLVVIQMPPVPADQNGHADIEAVLESVGADVKSWPAREVLVLCGTYTVMEGDNPSSIADSHDVAVYVLMAANPSEIVPGDELDIPCSVDGVDPAVSPSGNETCEMGRHTIREGDYPSHIAAEYDITVDDLKAANVDNPDYDAFYVGLEILIPCASGITESSVPVTSIS